MACELPARPENVRHNARACTPRIRRPLSVKDPIRVAFIAIYARCLTEARIGTTMLYQELCRSSKGWTWGRETQGKGKHEHRTLDGTRVHAPGFPEDGRGGACRRCHAWRCCLWRVEKFWSRYLDFLVVGAGHRELDPALPA